MINKPVLIGLFASLAFGNAMADDSGFKLEPLHVTGSFETGQIVDYLAHAPDNQGNRVNNGGQLIDHSAVWVLQQARLSENVNVFLGVGGMYFFYQPNSRNNGNTFGIGQRSAFGLTDAHGEFEFWRLGGRDHGLLLKAGIFPYKYNKDAKNLGEYMFRTYTYPTIITTGGLVLVNSAGAQLNGFDANTQYGGFKNDLLLTDKTNQVPTGSLSLTDIFSYTYRNLLTLGGGYMFDNFYNPDGVADGLSSAGTYSPSNSEYYISGADTLHYSFVGQKAMIRASIEFGNLIASPLLSPTDLRVYFEAVVMGVKDYPGYYQSMIKRTAFMYGVNLPTFHILDLLSVELEYCSNPYSDDIEKVTDSYEPVPVTSTFGGGDNVKWSIYAQKNIVKGFSISAQAARDHLRLVDFYGKTDNESVMEESSNWYWLLQLNYSI